MYMNYVGKTPEGLVGSGIIRQDVLEDGAVPLMMLGAKIERWIDQVRGG